MTARRWFFFFCFYCLSIFLSVCVVTQEVYFQAGLVILTVIGIQIQETFVHKALLIGYKAEFGQICNLRRPQMTSSSCHCTVSVAAWFTASCWVYQHFQIYKLRLCGELPRRNFLAVETLLSLLSTTTTTLCPEKSNPLNNVR